MSSPDRTQQIPGPQTGTAPRTYEVPSSFAFDLMAVRAVFDGTAAAGAFLPCIQIVSDSGAVMAQVKGASVAAGSSADVTFAPFLEDETASGGTDPLAVHYNTSPQVGTFLVSTTSTGTTITDSGVGQINIQADDGAGGGGFVGITTADGEVFVGSTTIVNRLNPAGGNFEVQNSSHVNVVQVQESGYIFFHLLNGVQFAILDHLGNTILRVDEGGGVPSFHLPVGAAWVADL